MLIRALFFIGFICLNFFGFSQTEKAREVTKVLCSDSLFGRGYVNNGMEKAADYIAAEFKEAGLKTYFNDSYFQPFNYAVNTFPGKMKVQLNGEELTPGKDFLVDPVSGSFSGKLKLTRMDSTILEDPSAFIGLRGDITSGEANAFFFDTRGATGDTEAEMLRRLREYADIAPVVFSTSKKFVWSVGRVQLAHPAILIKDYVFTDDMELEVDIEAELEPEFEAKNVVGYISAEKKGVETIVFTAHYDHLGGMGDKTYFPGANDNASGTAMLISLANHYKENPLKDYNLLFIAFAGEEAGLIGSQYFVDKKSYPLYDIKFLLNLDIMGSGEEGITVVNGNQLKKEFKRLQKLNEKEKYLPQVKPRGETANSDHYFFYKNEVPSFFIYAMGPNKNYHDIYDTHEDLSFAEYDDIVHLLIDFVEGF